MTREERLELLKQIEERLDWLYRLRSEIYVYMPYEWIKSMDEALTESIKALEQEPCEDCISRAKAIENIKHAQINFSVESDIDFTKHKREVQEIADGILNAQIKVLSDLSSVHPKPKTGHWIEDAKTYYEELNKRGLGVDEYTPYFTDDIACSECLAKYSMLDNETQFFKYCPNCGAKMESEE